MTFLLPILAYILSLAAMVYMIWRAPVAHEDPERGFVLGEE